MRKLLWTFLSFLFLLALPVQLYSSNCGVATYSFPSYQYAAPVVVQQVIVPYTIPLYSVGYQPAASYPVAGASYQQQGAAASYQGGTTPDSLSQLDKWERIAAAMERSAAALERGASSQPGGQAQQQQESPHVAIMRQHCAACHSGQGSKGGHQMFDQAGAITQWTPEMLGKVVDRISRESGDPQRMPPGRELGYQEHKAIMRGLVSQPPPQQQAQQPPAPQPQTLPKEMPPPQ